MRSLLSLFAILAFFTNAANGAPAKSCNCVAFRMDDIQDYWLDQTQSDVINVFKESNTPLTSVIIAADFGDDSTVVNMIINYLNYAHTSGWDYEVGCHGWTHVDFSAKSLAQQSSWLSQARTKTVNLLAGAGVTNDNFITFVPPLNAFNANTVSASKSNGFHIFSAGEDEEIDNGRATPGTDSTFAEFPMQASTTDLDDVYKISAEETMTYVDAQIRDYGFSVIMMHFVEFSNDDGTTNQTAIDDLKNLIQLVKNAGYTPCNLRGMRDMWFGSGSSGVATTGKVPVATTGKAPVATTGKAAVATTGKASVATTSKAPVATTGKAPVATTGQAVPATTGKVVPATTSQSAPATTSQSVPATTGKAIPSTTGQAVPSTTGAVATPSPPTSSPTQGSVIAFKIEQVQDYYESKASAAVIQAFQAAGVPLSVGIIPYYFGSDSSIVNPTKSALAACAIEIACNGYKYEDFTKSTLAKQETLLDNAIASTQASLGVTPKVFFPPEFSFGPNTLTALAAKGFNVMSVVTSVDPAPYNANNPAVYHFPAGASTANLDNTAQHFTAAKTWTDVNTQLAANKFAVVILTPDEFSTSSGTVNTTMITQLNTLLSTAKSSGKSLVFVSQLSPVFGGPASSVTCTPPKPASRELNARESAINLRRTADLEKLKIERENQLTVSFSVSKGKAILIGSVSTFVIFAIIGAAVIISRRRSNLRVREDREGKSDASESLISSAEFSNLKRRTSSAIVANKA